MSENLKRWAVLDNTTTTGTPCNEEHVKNTQCTDNGTGIISNGGTMDINEKAHFKGVCNMPHDERAPINSFCLFNLMNLGCRVHMNNDVENAFCGNGQMKLEFSDQTNTVHASLIHLMK